MRLSIHQSQYLPWPPYFKKIAASDCFVLMDSVQFQKNGMQNRNRIRNRQGEFWLTIPVKRGLDDTIVAKRVADGIWAGKHWKSLRTAYARAPFWNRYEESLRGLYEQDYQTLGQANEAFLGFLLDSLEIDTPVVRLSSLGVSGAKSELVLNICRRMGALCYVSGTGAAGYLDVESFERAGIDIEFMTSSPPVYLQGEAHFIPGLSMIDMLMHQGPERVQSYLKE